MLTSRQGSSGWERLTDEVSGRFYFYNPATGATSWTIPEAVSPTSPVSPSGPTAAGRHDGGPVRAAASPSSAQQACLTVLEKLNCAEHVGTSQNLVDPG